MSAAGVLAQHQWGTGACVCGQMVCGHDDLAAHQLDALKAAGFEIVERDRLTRMIEACNQNANDAAEDDAAHCEEMFYRGQAVAYSVVLDGTLAAYEQVLAGTAEAGQ